MKLISWNVNGLRACLKKDFMDSFQALDADIFCLQETKLQHHAGQSADHGQQKRFDQKLRLNLPGQCAKRLLQADLRGALRHGGQHHVHDADSADHQRDGRNARQQRGHHGEHLLHGVLDAGHGGHGKAVLLVAEHRDHGGLDAARGGLAVQAVGEIDGEAGHVAGVVHLQRRGVGDEDVGAAGHQAGHAGIAVLAEQPRHQEGDAVDVQALTDGIHAVEEALHHVGADPADEGGLRLVHGVELAPALEQALIGAEVVGVLAGHGDVRLVAAAPGDPCAEGYAGGQAVHLVHGGKFGKVVRRHAGLQVAARDADHQRACAHGAEGRG